MKNRYSIKEAAEVLEISRQTINTRIRSLNILPIKEGRHKFITHEQLEKLSKEKVNNRSIKYQDRLTEEVLRKQTDNLMKINSELLEQNKNLIRQNENSQELQFMASKRVEELEKRLVTYQPQETQVRKGSILKEFQFSMVTLGLGIPILLILSYIAMRII